MFLRQEKLPFHSLTLYPEKGDGRVFPNSSRPSAMDRRNPTCSHNAAWRTHLEESSEQQLEEAFCQGHSTLSFQFSPLPKQGLIMLILFSGRFLQPPPQNLGPCIIAHGVGSGMLRRSGTKVKAGAPAKYRNAHLLTYAKKFSFDLLPLITR